jgi:hypothetical protein
VSNAAPDTTAPTVSVSAPAAGATVSGTVNVSADASDNVGVVGVQFLLDGVSLGAEDTAAPYSVSWNSTGATNGAHTLTARARDAAGNQTTSAAVSVTVSNDTTPPVLSNALPSGTLAAGTTQTTLSVTSNENATCRYATTAGTAYGSMPNSFSTTGGTAHSTLVTGLANGQSYSWYVRCQDSAGNANTSDTAIAFSVAAPPDTTAPTVTATSPASGATAFSEAMDATTVSTTTVELRDPSGALVPAVVSYSAANRRVTLNPNPTLTALTIYTVTIKGGTTDPRVKDVAGNALASSRIWSFTTR